MIQSRLNHLLLLFRGLTREDRDLEEGSISGKEQKKQLIGRLTMSYWYFVLSYGMSGASNTCWYICINSPYRGIFKQKTDVWHSGNGCCKKTCFYTCMLYTLFMIFIEQPQLVVVETEEDLCFLLYVTSYVHCLTTVGTPFHISPSACVNRHSLVPHMQELQGCLK